MLRNGEVLRDICRKEEWGVKGHLRKTVVELGQTAFTPQSWSPGHLWVVVLAE